MGEFGKAASAGSDRSAAAVAQLGADGGFMTGRGRPFGKMRTIFRTDGG
jgi:hypothetical protein